MSTKNNTTQLSPLITGLGAERRIVMAAQKFAVTGDQYRDVSRKIREILRQLDQRGGSSLDPKRVSEKLQEIIEPKGDCMALEQAINILGQSKVISDEQSAKSWERFPPILAIIHYREKTLRQCAKENEKGQDWRLVYCHGLSLYQLREKCGIDWKNHQPCFHEDSDDWLKFEVDNWENQSFQAGYYLLDFIGQYGNISWDDQEVEITKRGKEYKRCPETIFTEAVFTIFMVNNGERIAEDWWHWGLTKRSNGRRVFVGNFRKTGFYFSDARDNEPSRYQRVVILRKFDY